MRAVLLSLLLASRALADDVPRVEPVEGGYFVNSPGMAKLNLALAEMQRSNIRLDAENASLKADVEKAAARPVLTPTAAVVLVTVGVVIGAGAAALVCVAAR